MTEAAAPTLLLAPLRCPPVSWGGAESLPLFTLSQKCTKSSDALESSCRKQQDAIIITSGLQQGGSRQTAGACALGPGALLCSSQVICAQPGCQVSSVMIFFSSARYVGAVRAGWCSLPEKTGLVTGLCCSTLYIWKLYLVGDTCGC